MKLNKILLGFLIITAFSLVNLPSFANELDEECATFCKDNGNADGHYLAQEPGSKCNEGYVQHEENQICCCKPAE